MAEKTEATNVESGAPAEAGAPNGVNVVEAPVTLKAYLICAFAALGGIFFGYDSGYINGVLGMTYFVKTFTGMDPDTTPPSQFKISSQNKSLMTSILSAGTFFGAIIAGDIADFIGRRTTIIAGCGIFNVGVILQVAATDISLMVPGRLIAGFGVGFVSAMIILYMSEIAPRKVRGAMVSGYQFCVTIGLLLASCVNYGMKDYNNSASYRVPIALQFLWALILAVGLFFLPESPRYHVKKGRPDRAAQCLARVRGQPIDSEYVQSEIAEIIANHEYEIHVIPSRGYFDSWFNCFRGNIFHPNSNIRRTVMGTAMQMMQQWTGVNFVFYYGTTFFQDLGTIKNPFLISLITTLVNVCATPIAFWAMERLGRRVVLMTGALGMVICQFIVAITGVVDGQDNDSVKAMISFICIYIAFFACTWGPGAWVVIGEIFPLPIRSRGVGLSTASNWLWNCIIAVITPYMVDEDKGNLRAKVFFVWGSLCACAFVFTYFIIPETKGLTLEQVDKMMEETTPRTSSKWKPTSTYADDMGLQEKEVAQATHQEA